MDGKWIRGTGAYEVKEVAPISAIGGLWTQLNFNDGWTSYNGSILDGKKITATSTATQGAYYNNLITVGKSYRIKYKAELFRLLESSNANINIFNGFSSRIVIDLSKTGVFEHESIFVAQYDEIYIRIDSAQVGDYVVFEYFIIEELPDGYPLLDKGDKYLECTSSGTLSFPSKIAYGTWEFDVHHASGEQRIYFICDLQDGGYGVADAYMLYLSNADQVTLYSSSPNLQLLASKTSYIIDGVWYRFKITRTNRNVFTVYIKGGDFGYDDWTLVSTAGGAGSNPVTNSNHLSCRYFSIDMDAIGSLDKIANIKISNQVEQ